MDYTFNQNMACYSQCVPKVEGSFTSWEGRDPEKLMQQIPWLALVFNYTGKKGTETMVVFELEPKYAKKY